jgi:urease accessory protein
MAAKGITIRMGIMSDEPSRLTPLALLRLQTWLSPTFPIGAYSYSHGLERAVEAGYVCDRENLVDWLEADLIYGSLRNDAWFFHHAWRCAIADDRQKLLEIAELAAAFRATSEFALESSQQADACLSTLPKVWPHPILDWLSKALSERGIQPALSVVLGAATQHVPSHLALPAFVQSVVGGLVLAAVRLIPLGQTEGQLAVAELEEAVLAASAAAEKTPVEELGSAAFMVDLASMEHESQYTRLFRS